MQSLKYIDWEIVPSLWLLPYPTEAALGSFISRVQSVLCALTIYKVFVGNCYTVKGTTS